MADEATVLHQKGVEERGNVYLDIHDEIGSVAEGFGAADAVHEMTYSTSRVQHVHLETHGSIAWRDDNGRIHVRTSSQAPFMAEEFAAWQQKIGEAVAAFPGFIRQSVLPPIPPTQVDWVILQSFTSTEAATSWLNSGLRLELLSRAQPMLAGPDDVHIIKDGARLACCRRRSPR
jgi:hypothetical protein